MSRMVKDYVRDYYMPAAAAGERMDGRQYALARELTAWERFVRDHWNEVSVTASGPSGQQIAEGEPVHVEALARLGQLTPADVRVELVTARDENGKLVEQRVAEMRPAREPLDGALRYTAEMDRFHTGSVVYGVRVAPCHPGLASPFELGLIRWA
jgi:starch phosphorylase